MPRKKAAITNPFYAILVVAGVAFFITAFAYGVMAFRAVSPKLADADSGDHPLMKFMDEHGMMLLGAEVAVLAIAAFAAMGTDDYWTRRANPSFPERPDEKPDEAKNPTPPGSG